MVRRTFIMGKDESISVGTCGGTAKHTCDVRSYFLLLSVKIGRAQERGVLCITHDDYNGGRHEDSQGRLYNQ